MSKIQDFQESIQKHFNEHVQHRNCFDNIQELPEAGTFEHRQVKYDGSTGFIATTAYSEYKDIPYMLRINEYSLEKMTEPAIDWYAKKHAVKMAFSELSLLTDTLSNLTITYSASVKITPETSATVFDKAIEILECPSRLYISNKNMSLIRNLPRYTFKYASEEEKQKNRYFIGKYMIDISVFALPRLRQESFIFEESYDGLILNTQKPYFQITGQGLIAQVGAGFGIIDPNSVAIVNVES